MTVDVPTAALVPAAATVVWFLLRLTVFDAIRRLEAGAKDQGRRLGELESWTVAHDKVEAYARRRHRTLAQGVPIPDDEDSTP